MGEGILSRARRGDNFEEALAEDWQRRTRLAAESASDFAPHQQWVGSPGRMEAQDAAAATPFNGVIVPYLPAIGPALKSGYELRTGHPLEALRSETLAVLDLGALPIAGRVGTAVSRGIGTKTFTPTANQVTSKMRKLKMAVKGEEIHHSIPLDGLPRNIKDWRNYPPFLKVLPRASHRRLRGKWDEKPKYEFLQRLWVGTPTWMKTAPAWVIGRGMDLASHWSDQQQSGPLPALPPRAPYGERPLR